VVRRFLALNSRRGLATSIVATLLVASTQTIAHAETASDALETCVVDAGDVNSCATHLGDAASTEADRATRAITNTLLDVQFLAETTGPGAVGAVSALVSDAVGQFEDLTGLRAYVDGGVEQGGVWVEGGAFLNGEKIVYTEQRVRVRNQCLSQPTSCFLLSSPSETKAGGFSTAKFEWVLNAQAYWDPDDTASCGCADGKAVWNLYRASPQFHDAFDFYSMGMWSSVSPVGGARFKQLVQEVGPKEHPEIVEADPLFWREDGNGGSVTIAASLSGQSNAPQGGGSFSISRTWNFSKDVAAGRVLSSDLHQVGSASKNERGDTVTRSTTGATTWKVPKKRAPKWHAAAGVYYTQD
jgi:hypothetical protein